MSNTMWGGGQRGPRPGYRPGPSFWLIYGLLSMVNLGIALLVNMHHPAYILTWLGGWLITSAVGITAIWGGLTWWDRRKR